jgi:hypothetical protein
MNAIAPIAATIIREGPAWERYLPSVEAMVPGQSEEQKRHRAGLMLLRDTARARQEHASEEAAAVLGIIVALASAHAVSALTAQELSDTRLALIRMMTAARELEKVFGDHGGG